MLCPTCLSEISNPAAAPGQILACPQCGNQFLVPAASATAPATNPGVGSSGASGNSAGSASGVAAGASGSSSEAHLKSATYPLPPAGPAAGAGRGVPPRSPALAPGPIAAPLPVTPPPSGTAPYSSLPQHAPLPPLATAPPGSGSGSYPPAAYPPSPTPPTLPPPAAPYAAPPLTSGMPSGGRAPSLLGGGLSGSSSGVPLHASLPPTPPLAGPPPLGSSGYGAPPLAGTAPPSVAPPAVPIAASPSMSASGPPSALTTVASTSPPGPRSVAPLPAAAGGPSGSTARFVGGAAAVSVPASPASPVSPPVPAASPAPASVGSGSANPVRAARSAKFIAADAQATRFDLTADGKLPELVLSDSEKSAAAEPQAPRGQPWFLIILMTFSILSSVLMLLVDASPTSGPKSDQAAAREAIRALYTGQPPNLEPYHRQLRLALQAGQRGDRDEERRLYQEVLTLLRSEGTSKFRGLTGMATSGVDPPIGPPNDRHLERLISILLSDE